MLQQIQLIMFVSSLKRLNGAVIENIVCPVCTATTGALRYSYLWEDKESNIIECSRCKHWFIEPIPCCSHAMESVDDGIVANKFLKLTYFWFIIKNEIKAVSVYTKNIMQPKLLDVGSGIGWITAFWRDNGFSVTGLDPSSSRAEFAVKKFNVPTIVSDIENLSLSNRYDVINLHHVLEHLSDPAAALIKLRKLLEDKGVLCIVVPNIHSVTRLLFPFDDSLAWALPYHRHWFCISSLRQLLESNGFKVKKIYRFPGNLWCRDMVSRKVGVPFLQSLINKLPRLFWILLFLPLTVSGLFFGLSDTITIIAGKDSAT